jgi:RNA polymerase sigma factor (TIGR02999 family)
MLRTYGPLPPIRKRTLLTKFRIQLRPRISVPCLYDASLMGDLTQILERAQSGDPRASEELLPLVYEELRKLAGQKLAHERPGQTLQPTALVHDAWLRLGGTNHDWNSRGHFFAAAAEAMRRILIDRARKRNRERHGAGLERINLDSVDLAATTDDDTLLRLDDALLKFAVEEPDKAALVKLRFFSGLNIPDAALALGISEATAKRHWAYARAWLYCELTQSA